MKTKTYIYYILGPLLLIKLLTGCSKKHDPQKTSKVYKPQSAPSPQEPFLIESILKKTSLTCSSTHDCPDNVGLIYINTKNPTNPFSYCTGFVVSNSSHSAVIGTSGHCLPKDFLPSGPKPTDGPKKLQKVELPLSLLKKKKYLTVNALLILISHKLILIISKTMLFLKLNP